MLDESKSDTMRTKRLLLGDEALALGAIKAGLSGAYAYPGTPSTEIMEYVQGDEESRRRGIHCHWSSNEKTALEAALGMSYAACHCVDEARGPERGGRSVRELGHDGRQRRSVGNLGR